MNFSTILRTGAFVALSFVPFTAHAQSASLPVSGSNSTITASPATVAADGVQRVTITVLVRDRYERAMPDKRVSISVSDPETIIIPLSPVTDSMGRATFAIKSSVVGEVIVSAMIGSMEVYTKKSVSFTEPPACAYKDFELIKLADDGNDKTEADYQIYYYGRDCKRHPFPANAFESWYPDGTNVTTVSAEVMASIKLGSNVDHKYGKFVRFQSDARIYSAGRGGVLHDAVNIDPAKEVDVLSDALYINYTYALSQ